MNAASDFLPDSRHLLIYSTANGGFSQIYETDLDGGDLHRITHSGSLEVEPKVNPSTGRISCLSPGAAARRKYIE